MTVEFDGPSRCGSTRSWSRRSTARASRAEEIQRYVINSIVKPILPEDLVNGESPTTSIPTGRFVVGGPHGDCGLTGRKIIVDTYGGWARHGGGAFSGKDPTKVDRSAAYMARHVAKNIVAAGLADRCEVQLAYAIGVSDPVSVLVDTDGTGKIDDLRLCDLARDLFPMTPGGIIRYLDLRRPIYRKTASGGHFGRSEPEFTWEKTEPGERVGRGRRPGSCRQPLVVCRLRFRERLSRFRLRFRDNCHAKPLIIFAAFRLGSLAAPRMGECLDRLLLSWPRCCLPGGDWPGR